MSMYVRPRILYPSLVDLISGFEFSASFVELVQLGCHGLDTCHVCLLPASEVCSALGSVGFAACAGAQTASSRDIMLRSALLMAAGSVAVCYVQSCPQLLLVRMLGGVVKGVCCAAKTTYIAETAEDGLPATAVALCREVRLAGAILGTLAGAALVTSTGAWRLLLGAGALPAAAMAAGVSALPQSPLWLVHCPPPSAAPGKVRATALAVLLPMRCGPCKEALPELNQLCRDSAQARAAAAERAVPSDSWHLLKFASAFSLISALTVYAAAVSTPSPGCPNAWLPLLADASGAAELAAAVLTGSCGYALAVHAPELALRQPAAGRGSGGGHGAAS